MQGFVYFPAIVYRDERPDLVQKILPTCVQYLNQVRNPNQSFCQSKNLTQEPTLKDVTEYLLSSSVELLRSQGYLTEKYDFYFSGLWAQEINHGVGTNAHFHKNSQMCGWFFLETPENGAYPIYYDTRMNKSMIELDFVQNEEITNATNSIHFNNMEPGTVMFGNSWMQHQLSVHSGKTPTRCLHFIISHRERLCNIH